MYLLGGKHFQLATDHKPLLPLFNNPQAKLPPRIERLIMKMQNLDFTMIHIPGKENVTDYMSRHPLPYSERTGVEKHVRAVTQADHAVVLEKIATETEQDAELQHLKHAMQTGVWDKKDPSDYLCYMKCVLYDTTISIPLNIKFHPLILKSFPLLVLKQICSFAKAFSYPSLILL
jgi:hypothetical protein